MQAHTLLTINGRIEIQRRRWHIGRQGSTTPADSLVELSEATVSLGARELCCRLNANASSFEKAAENLKRAAQIHLSGELLRQVVETEGKSVMAANQAELLSPVWKASECRTPEGKSRVYMGADGVMVPHVTDAEKQKRRERVRGKRQRRGRRCKPLPTPKRGADQSYKEFKIVTFYDQEMTRRLVSVTRGNHEAAGRLMRRDARRIDLKSAEERVGNVDGSPWIVNQTHKQRLKLSAVGLDFYHFGENVHKGRRSAFGEQDGAGESWAGQVLHVAKHEGYDRLWNQLVTWRGGLKGRAQRRAADQLLNYVSDRRAMILYPAFLARGWQIGSGPTESMCKLVPKRLKGTGMRWDSDNAEAVACLEAMEQSHHWSQYWAASFASRN